MAGQSDAAIKAADLALIERGAAYVQPLALGRTAVEAAYPVIRADVLAEVAAWLEATRSGKHVANEDGSSSFMAFSRKDYADQIRRELGTHLPTSGDPA
jgi:hypothetical protein